MGCLNFGDWRHRLVARFKSQDSGPRSTSPGLELASPESPNIVIDRSPAYLNPPSDTTPHLSEENSLGIKTLNNERFPYVDIVFIHGLTGNAYRTWFDKESGKHWPRDLLSQDLAGARIMTFGYDADVANFFGPAALDGIAGYAYDLLGCLAGCRDGLTSDKRKIIFVAHSLGGLVVKKAIALSHMSRDDRLGEIQRNTAGIVFLGTPHQGSDLAALGSILTNIVSTVKPANKQVVKILKRDSEMLASVNDDFHNVLEKRKKKSPMDRISIVCFYEQLPLPRMKELVVPKESAVLHGELQFPIHKNHKDMTKWTTKNDKGYQDILRELSIMVESPAFRRFWVGLGETDSQLYMRQTTEPLPGTFRWIEKYARLVEQPDGTQPHRLVHITGQPGCGKSVLAASLCRRLLSHESEQALVLDGAQSKLQGQSQTSQKGKQTVGQDENHALCVTPLFYAFNGRDATRRSPHDFLAAMIRQLFLTKQTRAILRQHFDKNYLSKEGPEFPALYPEVFQWALGLPVFGHIVCIVDGLDECDQGPERDYLIKTFKEILLCCDYNITLVLLNRDYWDLSFEGLALPADANLHIELDRAPETRADLRSFTDNIVQELVQRRPAYGAFQSRLADKIFNRANEGMFLMAYLVTELLYKSTDSSPMGIDRTINSLPSTLQEVYQRIWNSIDSKNKAHARRIMRWMVALQEPVTEYTLSDAIAHELMLEHEKENWEGPIVCVDDFRPRDLRGDVKRLFGPLVTFYSSMGLAHQTVKEFFTMPEADFKNPNDAPRVLSPTNGHIKIALTCEFCLRMHGTEKAYNSNDSIVGVGVPPFYTYALRNHEHHFSAAVSRNEDSESIEEYKRLIHKTSGRSIKQGNRLRTKPSWLSSTSENGYLVVRERILSDDTD